MTDGPFTFDPESLPLDERVRRLEAAFHRMNDDLGKVETALEFVRAADDIDALISDLIRGDDQC